MDFTSSLGGEMPNLKMLVLVVAACSIAIAVHFSAAQAGCWECVAEPYGEGDVAYVCVGHAVGSGDYFATCIPRLASENYTWCTLTGSYPTPCGEGQGACPGCRREPFGDRPRASRGMLTTQVLILDLHGKGAPLGDGLIYVDDSSGLDAGVVAEQFASELGTRPTVAGFAVESRPGATMSRHQAPDGTELVVRAHQLRGGALIELAEARKNGVQIRRAPAYVPEGAARWFQVQLADRTCAIVVHTMLTLGSDEAALAATAQLHEVFLGRVANNGVMDLVGLSTDWPSLTPTRAFPEAVRRLTGDMLMSSLLSVSRRR